VQEDLGFYIVKYLNKMAFHSTFAKYTLGETVLDIWFAQKPNTCIKNKKLYGVDIQKVEKPENYLEIKFANLNKECLPYSDSFFDTVIIGDAIEHVENPSHLLRECNRVLRENGRFIVSTPQASYFFTSMWNFIYSCTGYAHDNDPGEHLSNWTMLDFRRLLRKNGFEVEKLIGWYIYLPYITIPVGLFPILWWQVIYICKKMELATDRIYTKSSYSEPVKIIENN
jgi:SAM-dependent methyltransferase